MEELLPKSGYRKRIENAVKPDATHPFNNGIPMQAHHLLSAKGVQLANMGKKLAALGYDINVLENLVLLPCTLDGACHLGVQLHRGDHTYKDDDHPISYHKLVQKYVEQLESFLDACSGCDNAGDAKRQRQKVQKRLDKVSSKILKKIAGFRVPLTRIHRAFEPDNPVGCSGKHNISDHHAQNCPQNRQHKGDNGISFDNDQVWTLQVGK